MPHLPVKIKPIKRQARHQIKAKGHTKATPNGKFGGIPLIVYPNFLGDFRIPVPKGLHPDASLPTLRSQSGAKTA
jgi:hypothetical protein